MEILVDFDLWHTFMTCKCVLRTIDYVCVGQFCESELWHIVRKRNKITTVFYHDLKIQYLKKKLTPCFKNLALIKSL